MGSFDPDFAKGIQIAPELPCQSHARAVQFIFAGWGRLKVAPGKGLQNFVLPDFPLQNSSVNCLVDKTVPAEFLTFRQCQVTFHSADHGSQKKLTFYPRTKICCQMCVYHSTKHRLRVNKMANICPHLSGINWGM